MPIFDFRCDTCHDVVEHYMSNREMPDPVCEACGGPRKRCISTFGIVNTGLLGGKYNDRTKEFAHQSGHWVMETDPVTGKKNKPLYLETFQDQREYCKREKLYNPGEIGQMEAGSDGKSYSSRGLPGAW